MNTDGAPIQEAMLPYDPAIGAYALHKMVYDRVAVAGEPRGFLFSPVRRPDGSGAVIVRGDLAHLALPERATRPVVQAEVGDVLAFTLRANPTVKCNGKRKQIGLSKDRDSLRLRWIDRRAAEHGFEVVATEVSTQPVLIDRKPTPFALNVAVYRGMLRVVDARKFAEALSSGIGRAAAWGCGLLIVSRPA